MKKPDAPRFLVRCDYDSPLGPMTLAASEAGLAGVWFNGQKHMPDAHAWPLQSDHPVLQQTMAELAQYFAGQRTRFSVPLDTLDGTAFQQLVWRALLGIDAGHTEAYGALSQRIGKPAAVRAVGAAVGRNPISIIIPCHRVVGADGSLTGYAGGLARKTALLQLECAAQQTIPA
jgi:methylated-DNA-[protein]-cysteine S-methyltransferase